MIVNEAAIRPPRRFKVRFPFTIAFVDCRMADEGGIRFTTLRLGALLVTWRPGWVVSWLRREERRDNPDDPRRIR